MMNTGLVMVIETAIIYLFISSLLAVINIVCRPDYDYDLDSCDFKAIEIIFFPCVLIVLMWCGIMNAIEKLS